MSELMLVGYLHRDQATVVLDTMRRLEIGWLQQNDVAVVTRDKRGNLQMPELRQPKQGRAIPWCALWRRQLDSSARSGCGVSQVATRPASAVGIPDSFARGTGPILARAGSALIIWAKMRIPPRVYEYVCSSAQDVMRTPVSPEQEALLVSVLDVLGPVERKRA